MNDKLDIVCWDRGMLERLRIQTRWAQSNGLKSFTFDGRVYLVAFARYLVIYLDGALK